MLSLVEGCAATERLRSHLSGDIYIEQVPHNVSTSGTDAASLPRGIDARATDVELTMNHRHLSCRRSKTVTAV